MIGINDTLSVEETADILKVSTEGIYALIQYCQLPYVKAGQCISIPILPLYNWLRSFKRLVLVIPRASISNPLYEGAVNDN